MSDKAETQRARIALAAIALLAVPAFFVFKSITPTPRGVSAAQDAPNLIRVPGIVRDFRRDHPDFNVSPAFGNGHYASVVDFETGADGRPVHHFGAYKVAREWYNKFDTPIAPHLYRGLTPIQVASPPDIDHNATIDSWDPEAGRYGEDGNIGPAPDIHISSDLPELNTPPDLGPSIGNVNYKTGVTVVSSSFHCNKLFTQVSSQVIIEGDVTIYCDEAFNMGQYSSIELADDATLRLYVNGPFTMTQESKINILSLDPYRVTIYHLGSWDMDISQYSEICATVYAPNSDVDLGQGVQFYGIFIGQSITMKQDSFLHSAGSRVYDACGAEIKDRTGLIDIFTQPAIESAATFNQWYRDVLGTNLSQIHTIKLYRNAMGIYETRLPDFYPVDNRLYGNEGMDHNHFFTYTFSASFTYDACANQFFEFGGADDAWLFIDGELSLDIGGVKPGQEQVIELERLELVDGQSYTLHFFYAQRNPDYSSFNLRTNVPIVPATLYGVGSASFD